MITTTCLGLHIRDVITSSKSSFSWHYIHIMTLYRLISDNANNYLHITKVFLPCPALPYRLPLCTTSHYTTPHHAILHYTTPHHTTPHHTTLHYNTLHHTSPHHTTPHYTTQHKTTLHHPTPHHTRLH